LLECLADFTVFFADGFLGILRAAFEPERPDADFAADFLTTFFALPLADLFLVAAFFAAMA
jgi:hypothetical protein